MEAALVDKEVLKERLKLITETRAKIEKMKISSVFVTDFTTMRLLARLLDGYQDLMAENINLHKHAKIQEVTKKIRKKHLVPKKKDS